MPETPSPVTKVSGLVALSLILSRILGLGREMVMANQFGSSADTDAYRLAFQIPDLLFFLLAGGAISAAFIPVFTEYLQKKKEDDAWLIFGSTTSLVLTALIALGGVAWAFHGPLLDVLAPGHPELYKLISGMTRILLPTQIAFFLGGMLLGTMYAQQVFSAPGLSQNIYNIGVIVGAVVLARLASPSVMGMAWGALGGAIIGHLVLPLIGSRGARIKLKLAFDWQHPGVKRVFKEAVPMTFGLGLPLLFGVIIQRYGSMFPYGVNTNLGYANEITQPAVAIFGQSLAFAVFPALSHFVAKKRMDQFRDQLTRTLCLTIFLSVPIAFFLIAAPQQVVGALFQGGKFTPVDTFNVAQMLLYFAFGITGWCIYPLMIRALFALHDGKTAVTVCLVSTCVFVAAVEYLAHTPLVFLALPAATSLVALLMAMALIVVVSKKAGGIDYVKLEATLSRCVLCGLAIAAIVETAAISPFGKAALTSKPMAILFVVSIFATATGIYFAITSKLKMPEADYLRRASQPSESSEDK